MKTKPGRGWILLVAVAFTVALLAGCRTNKIDWDSRVGNFSYDQAVVELGPPDKKAELSDGTIVAEWLTFRGRSHRYYHPVSPFYPYWIIDEPPSPDRFIRLIFGPEGELQQWRRFYR